MKGKGCELECGHLVKWVSKCLSSIWGGGGTEDEPLPVNSIARNCEREGVSP